MALSRHKVRPLLQMPCMRYGASIQASLAKQITCHTSGTAAQHTEPVIWHSELDLWHSEPVTWRSEHDFHGGDAYSLTWPTWVHWVTVCFE